MKIVVAEEFANLKCFISQLPRMMDNLNGTLIYDGRNRVSSFHYEGLNLMVKRFKRVNFVQQIVYTFFRKTKAERAYLFAEELKAFRQCF